MGETFLKGSNMTPSDVVTVRNFFQDYKIRSRDGSPLDKDQKRATSSLNYESLKKERVFQMTMRSKDPRLSLEPDPKTGIIGIIPNYQGLKNNHKEKVKPFFSSVRNSFYASPNKLNDSTSIP